MLIVIIAVLIAAAVSDTFGDRRAWLYVTIVATGYIVSRVSRRSGPTTGRAHDGAGPDVRNTRGGTPRPPQRPPSLWPRCF